MDGRCDLGDDGMLGLAGISELAAGWVVAGPEFDLLWERWPCVHTLEPTNLIADIRERLGVPTDWRARSVSGGIFHGG